MNHPLSHLQLCCHVCPEIRSQLQLTPLELSLLSDEELLALSDDLQQRCLHHEYLYAKATAPKLQKEQDGFTPNEAEERLKAERELEEALKMARSLRLDTKKATQRSLAKRPSSDKDKKASSSTCLKKKEEAPARYELVDPFEGTLPKSILQGRTELLMKRAEFIQKYRELLTMMGEQFMSRLQISDEQHKWQGLLGKYQQLYDRVQSSDTSSAESQYLLLQDWNQLEEEFKRAG